MSILNSLGIFSGENTSRVDSGQGKIYERTIELGEDVIVIENIGSIRVTGAKKNHAVTIFGAIIALMGIGLLTVSLPLGLLIMATGIGLAFWNLLKGEEIYLSIGTCDGKSAILVSKNRDFLNDIRQFLRMKIDTGSKSSATINISNSTLEGTFAVGENSHVQR